MAETMGGRGDQGNGPDGTNPDRARKDIGSSGVAVNTAPGRQKADGGTDDAALLQGRFVIIRISDIS
jgi:hypothetical protein